MPSTGRRPAGPLRLPTNEEQPIADCVDVCEHQVHVFMHVRMHLHDVTLGMHDIFRVTIDLDKTIIFNNNIGNNNIGNRNMEHEAIMQHTSIAVHKIIDLAEVQKLEVNKVMEECAAWEETDADGVYINMLMEKVLEILDEIIATSAVILKTINPAVLCRKHTVPCTERRAKKIVLDGLFIVTLCTELQKETFNEWFLHVAATIVKGSMTQELPLEWLKNTVLPKHSAHPGTLSVRVMANAKIYYGSEVHKVVDRFISNAWDRQTFNGIT
ncbi:uncharacterized protein BJ212DRAFT_1299133 [Suillus subaureus]|uniref:Uncharacterized protein n=1 Tax=Suillus subaureus TaxID=48587 RepID=A0A9P7EDC9_9AGAM|nr:uncharacterized protein BJ212DRAFT_1299133 [Suillus subaureus]KAG1817593.1 hypothetical protein BJ212DRAFT_1299133 [Suillus subaureus]